MADLGGKALGLGGENMNFMRILKSTAQGIALGLRYAHPTYMYICVLRKRSEEHTSELQSPVPISYAVFCLKKKNTKDVITYTNLSATS